VDAGECDDVFLVRAARFFQSRVGLGFPYRFDQVVSRVDFPKRPPGRNQAVGMFQRFLRRESDVRKESVRDEALPVMQSVGAVGKFSIRQEIRDERVVGLGEGHPYRGFPFPFVSYEDREAGDGSRGVVRRGEIEIRHSEEPFVGEPSGDPERLEYPSDRGLGEDFRESFHEPSGRAGFLFRMSVLPSQLPKDR